MSVRIRYHFSGGNPEKKFALKKYYHFPPSLNLFLSVATEKIKNLQVTTIDRDIFKTHKQLQMETHSTAERFYFMPLAQMKVTKNITKCNIVFGHITNFKL